jgi:hypothetical protein
VESFLLFGIELILSQDRINLTSSKEIYQKINFSEGEAFQKKIEFSKSNKNNNLKFTVLTELLNLERNQYNPNPPKKSVAKSNL